MAEIFSDDCELLDNDDFGVDGLYLSQEDASPPALAVPQFLNPSTAARQRPDSTNPNPWDPRLVLDLALAIDALPDILERYGLDEAQYNRLVEVPSFKRDLAVTMREVREKGLSFAKKAAVQAESYLMDLDDMVADRNVPASTRLAAIQSVVKWGRLEPKEEKTTEQSGVQVNLQINFTA